jgi:hypothetical protein
MYNTQLVTLQAEHADDKEDSEKLPPVYKRGAGVRRELYRAKVHNGRPKGQQSTRQADGLEMSARDDR